MFSLIFSLMFSLIFSLMFFINCKWISVTDSHGPMLEMLPHLKSILKKFWYFKLRLLHLRSSTRLKNMLFSSKPFNSSMGESKIEIYRRKNNCVFLTYKWQKIHINEMCCSRRIQTLEELNKTLSTLKWIIRRILLIEIIWYPDITRGTEITTPWLNN